MKRGYIDFKKYCALLVDRGSDLYQSQNHKGELHFLDQCNAYWSEVSKDILNSQNCKTINVKARLRELQT